MTRYDATGQVEAGLRYIRDAYGPKRAPLATGEAATFVEPGEDPAKVFAACDAGPHGVTAPPQAPVASPYNCGFCERGQCARCSDKRCECCAGNPGG